MIRINIINMDNFLKTVNECHGNVNVLYKNGEKQNINKQYFMQTKMMEQYRENKNYLPLEIEASDPEDYMKIVFFTIGDC